MTISYYYLIAAISIMALCTFVLRALPLLWLKQLQKSPFFLFLGKAMPLGVMTILVFYSVKDTFVGSANALMIPTITASIAVLTLQHFFHNTLISILTGVSLYLYLVN